MESLWHEEGVEGLEGACWGSPVSGVMPCCLPGLAGADLPPEPRSEGLGVAETVLPRLWLVLQGHGNGVAWLDGLEMELHVGDVALHVESPGSPAPRFHPHQEVWSFPLGAMGLQSLDISGRLPVVLPKANPATPLLLHFATGLATASADLPSSLRKQFLVRLLGMLSDTLASIRQSPEEIPRLARFHLHRIKSYLQTHLREPDLTVKRMAADLGISVSHIHRLFSREGGTVADWFWGERLEGCAGDLGSPAHAHRTVGEIALSWGFNDLSHFSHAFKKCFGITPREWRNRAPWRAPLHEGKR